MAPPTIRDSAISGKELEISHDENLSPISTSALDRIRSLLVLIAAAQPDLDKSPSSHLAEDQCHRLRELHVILIDTPHRLGRVKDDFRHADGFGTLLCVSASLAGLWSNIGPSRIIVELLRLLLSVLSEALCDYPPNVRFFTSHNNINRWPELQTHLLNFQAAMFRTDDDAGTWQRKFFNVLLSFAVREEGDTDLLRNSIDLSRSDADLRGHQDVILWLPDAVTLIAVTWRALISVRRPDRNQHNVALSQSILSALLRIHDCSHYNAVAMHGSGILDHVADDSDDQCLEQHERKQLHKLRSKLLKLGVSSSKAASRILKHSLRSSETATLLEQVLSAPNVPPHALFDLSLHGYASLELAALSGVFPPSERAGGYTFIAWFRIDEYDEECHTTLFGAFDPTQTCFLLLYLERDTKHLVLQTSLSSDRPSVRFKSTSFATGCWYHVAIVHEWPHTDGLGRATLFVNGKSVEKARCRYPQDPHNTALNGSNSTQSSTPPTSKRSIQAFFGTPKSLAPRLGTGVLRSRWSLACCQLVSRALPSELIFVYKNLGPGYVGNFQDSLGSFQTYETSTVLSLHHDALQGEQKDRSVIERAIKTQAKLVNHERNFALNMIIGSLANDAYCKTMQMPYGYSMVHGMHDGGDQQSPDVVFNLAAPCVSGSTAKSMALVIRHGGAKLFRARGLSHYVWQSCGGVSHALKMLKLAFDEEGLLQAVQTIFALVRHNWRLSESFEKESGFPIMCLLLRSKGFLRKGAFQEQDHPSKRTAPLSLRLLQLILKNIGYDLEQPALSVISNPLAYRSLVVDLDIWRSSEGPTQKLFYKQFLDLLTQSHHQQFNIKRLARMRILKRLINALKSEQSDDESLPFILQTLKSLLVHMPSADSYRSVALYITYAVSINDRNTLGFPQINPVPRPSTGKGIGLAHEVKPTRSLSASTHRSIPNSRPTSQEVGAKVLNIVAQVLYEDRTGMHIRKFARTVTNKWLLYLLSSGHEAVVGPCMKILSRLLVLQGQTYLSKFEDTTRGMMILARKLRLWWYLDTVWTSCFAIMFGFDPAILSNDNNFDEVDVLKAITSSRDKAIYCTTIFSVVAGMLEAALSVVDTAQFAAIQQADVDDDINVTRNRRTELGFPDQMDIVPQALRTLRKAHDLIPEFRDFCVQSSFVRELLRGLFVHADTSQSVFSIEQDHSNLDLNSHSRGASRSPSPARGSSSSPMAEPIPVEGGARHNTPVVRRRRHSSFVLVPTAESLQSLASTSNPHEDLLKPPSELDASQQDNTPLLVTVGLIVDVLCCNILEYKDFTGLGLFHKAPPYSFDLRANVNAYLIRKTMQRLQRNLVANSDRFHEPKALMNIARFCVQALEAYLEGWLVNGALALIEFNTTFLCHWQQPQVQAIKNVRLCSQSLAAMRATLARTSILHIARSTDTFSGLRRLCSLAALPMWMDVLIVDLDTTNVYFRPLFSAIVRLLPEADENDLGQIQPVLCAVIRASGEGLAEIFDEQNQQKYAPVLHDFSLAVQKPLKAVRNWILDHQKVLLELSLHAKNTILMPFIGKEEQAAAISIAARSTRRQERVEQWHLDDVASSHAWTEHQVSSNTWTENIVRSEAHKYSRSIQDQQESYDHLKFRLEKLFEPLPRLDLTDSRSAALKWQLDECESRDRMRLRLSPLGYLEEIGYEPKTLKSQRRKTQSSTTAKDRRDTQTPRDASQKSPVPYPLDVQNSRASHSLDGASTLQAERAGAGGEFEVIAEQHVEEEDEDKNRKVMRSLQRGEQVQNAFNVSRIVGLEAREGLLIVGKGALYLVDGLFQRLDGEVVNVEQAPTEERDQYPRILSGHEIEGLSLTKRQFEPTRHWPWTDILSFSKRQFLTRPVAIEVFFADGRSYLLTTSEEVQRDALYADLLNFTKFHRDGPQSETENTWRKNLLKNPGEGSSKLSQLLSPMVANPMTKQWIKGEVSNFHYLMWVNSQAGRTFNDLTQYPVFPWVLADYTSEELDLSNPRSYRDLTKPMGCQTIARAESFKERYMSLAEMDEQTPPFHYGTHYSSAMIVTSFLIRLQPFVQSHVLLQGGSFDHANRLFHSIEQAWRSASREGLSDVRELIPEFFYLSDFLRNVNGYNFGFRQGDNEVVDHVKLPPWAKGNAEIFISKHRQALESPYVSQNLHAWIDLVFGFKQRGEAARESTNVFHYLSYPGAKDLDSIQDQHERAATIGIIHNFGQTPRQIFLRPHDRRDNVPDRCTRLLEGMRSLARLRSPIRELATAVSALHFARQLLAGSLGTCLRPPEFDLLADWTNADHSLRLWTSDRRKMVGLHEQLHDSAITCALFTDSSTLLSASEDGTVAAWKAESHDDVFELHSKTTMFGHRSSVSVMTISRAFSILLTVSVDGHLILWDLNRFEFIRELHMTEGVQAARISDTSGRILLCCGIEVKLFTLNGHCLLSQDVSDNGGEQVTACDFYQNSSNAWFNTEVIITGHDKGVVKLWCLSINDQGQWFLELLNRLPTDRYVAGHAPPSITTVMAREQKVWAGDAQGCVFEWNAVR